MCPLSCGIAQRQESCDDTPSMCRVVCMSRTNIDIDDALIAEVMERFHLDTKKSAVEFALRRLIVSADPVELLDSLYGIGWDGDLDAMREGNRVEQW